MDAIRTLYLHALSGLHTGTGQSAGIIDLPVAREVSTNWPFVPGSTLKGVLRDACQPAEGEDRHAFDAAFGKATVDEAESAGSLWFSDARLLCLPVRSLYGTVAWLSCPLALRRWQRDRMNDDSHPGLAIPAIESDETMLVASPDAAIVNGGRVFLKDLDLPASANDETSVLAAMIAGEIFGDTEWETEFRTRFGIVSNDVFTFLAETCTEVTARVRLNEDTKTVARGALWYEEAVPAETIFACPVVAAPRAGQPGSEDLYAVLAQAGEQPVQIGGNASVGRGLTRLRLTGQPA